MLPLNRRLELSWQNFQLTMLEQCQLAALFSRTIAQSGNFEMHRNHTQAFMSRRGADLTLQNVPPVKNLKDESSL